MEEVALEGLRRWKSAQESNLDVALCLPYLSVLSKNPCCCERVVDEMMAVRDCIRICKQSIPAYTIGTGTPCCSVLGVACRP